MKDKRNRKNLLLALVLLAAVLLILSGGFTECMQKGSGICWECIGFG